MRKEYNWHGCRVQITKKKVKHTNLRIRPEEPDVIRVSIPCSMKYEAVEQILNQPRILRWVEKYQKKASESLTKPEMQKEDKQKQMAFYREHLQKILPDLILKWERILGVRCNKVTIRDTRSQWGSCSIRTKNISISVWLGAFSKDCVEYVVVHELVHLLEAGHNARFYGILDQHYPNWRSCREQLRRGSA